MFWYQLKLVINENKLDEFNQCLQPLVGGFLQEEGCLDFGLYRGIEKANTYIVVGEWKTSQAMDKHFLGNDFSVLIGAAKILGETFEISIGEDSERGRFELAFELDRERVSRLKNEEQLGQ